MEEVEWQRRIYAEIFTLAFYKQIASFPWPEKQKELVELSKILQNNSFQWKTGWGEKDRNRSENKTTEEYTCNWKAEIFSTKRLVSQTGLENHKNGKPNPNKQLSRIFVPLCLVAAQLICNYALCNSNNSGAKISLQPHQNGWNICRNQYYTVYSQQWSLWNMKRIDFPNFSKVGRKELRV